MADITETSSLETIVEDAFNQVERRPLRSLASIYSEIVHITGIDKSGQIDPEVRFDFARAVYRHCLGRLDELEGGDANELDGSRFYSVVLGEYALYRLFKSSHHDGLETNPFLIHFVGLYNGLIKNNGSLCNLESLLYGVLCRDVSLAKDLDQSTWTKITVTASREILNFAQTTDRPQPLDAAKKTIDVSSLRRLLESQWLEKALVDKAMSVLDPITPFRELERIHDSTENEGLSGNRGRERINQLVDRIIMENRESGAQEVLADVILNPFNSVSAEIFQRFLISPNIRGDYRQEILRQLTRVKATNVSVDFIHMAILGGLVSGEDDIRLLVYEFVLFNLQLAKLTENGIKLICTFILALHDKGILKPVEDYQMLFSSFINWIGVVGEAREVYLLS